MTMLSWVIGTLLGGWLLLWRRVGDRWGWLAMLNAWAEWGMALLGGLAALAALRRRWWQGGAFLALLTAVQGKQPHLSLFAAFAARELEMRAEAPAGAPHLTVFGANLFKKSPSAAAHVAMIREHRPDVVCLQELTPALAAELVEGLEARYPHRVWSPRPGAYGFGVLSRFPIEPVDEWSEPGVEPWCQRVRCTLPGGQTVDLYNVHLVPPTAKSTLERGARWGFRTREAQVEKIQAEIAAAGLPALVIGDHNFADSHDAYRIATRSLEDSWIAAGHGRGWSWPRRAFPVPEVPWNPPMLRLDYCFHNDALHPLDARLLTARTGSDHSPLLVHFAVT